MAVQRAPRARLGARPAVAEERAGARRVDAGRDDEADRRARLGGVGLGDDDPRLLVEVVEARVVGVEHLQRLVGSREVERAGLALARVAERPEPLTVGRRDGALERIVDLVPPTDVLDEPDRTLHGARRIVFETERHGEVEEHLRVGRSLDQRVQRRIDREREIALDGEPVVDQPVVHPEPLAVAERMAVRLLHRRPRRGADVREEEVRLDMAGELAQVAVVPGRLHALEDPRLAGDRVPADAESIPVRRLGSHARAEALLDQGVLRPEQDLVHPDGLPVVREPAAHEAILPSRLPPRRGAQPPGAGVRARRLSPMPTRLLWAFRAIAA